MMSLKIRVFVLPGLANVLAKADWAQGDAIKGAGSGRIT